MLLNVLMPVTTLSVNPVIPLRKAARIHVVVFLRRVRPDRDWKTANALRIVRVLCANQVTKRYPMRPAAAANLNRNPVRRTVQHATATAHVQNATQATTPATEPVSRKNRADQTALGATRKQGSAKPASPDTLSGSENVRWAELACRDRELR